ncbi:MAG TPA: FprA family A-type flavoprotein [Candidatus Eisenbacteria bacterium]|mgnify:CR=1 FL=1|uniref:FprA family A-type flavoprotein n=1 Tax=Eiseniibacteriota bacterium TaxID=2212470 RepID=A0A7V2AV54_UNCEI|nr:FprA family A-type flavoprotein [Candidatus Eisenbacteria bacterium]
MKEAFEAVRVTEKVYWVGAIDWNIRDFHGYSTHRGTTYNAYLVLADRVTLVDTVKAPFREELIARISSVIDPGKIDYIVSNHSEMDHSGCLPEMIDMIKPEKVFASTMGVKALADHFHDGLDVTEVKDGDRIDLGDMAITVLETRMLHWPDSMVSYLEEEKLLFSQDGFGMHLASSERFDDELPFPLLEHEARKYYANILLPFSRQVLKVLDRLAEAKLELDIVAPDHGPVWRKNQGRILELYRGWAEQRRGKKAVVAYDTMWGSTEKMAKAIADGLASGGASVKVMKLRAAHRSDIATEVLDAGALVVGSPTINNNIFPTIADILFYLKGLKPVGLIGAAFGSYGWSGEAAGQVEELLEGMKVEIAGEAPRVKYVPDKEMLENCRNLGRAIADKLRG